MSEARHAILIPAAGGSARLGLPKQLLQYRQRSLLQHAVALAGTTGPERLVVVLGCEAEAMEAQLADLPCTHASVVERVIHPRWQQGLGSSIAAGARHLHATGLSLPECSGILVLLPDQYRLQPRDLDRLVGHWRQQPQHPLAARYLPVGTDPAAPDAESGTVVGPPVIFPVSALPALCRLKGDQGARALLQSSHCRHLDLPRAAHDLDTRDDLARFKRWRQNREHD